MIKLYYRVVKYDEDGRKITILFTNRQSAENYILSHNPPLLSYTIIDEEEEDLESEE